MCAKLRVDTPIIKQTIKTVESTVIAESNHTPHIKRQYLGEK